MADESIIKKALNLARQGQEFVFPHASKSPFAPMAYVKDFNEWFMPAAQMALDEAAGEEEFPAWAYGLASLPLVGKPAKAVAKIAGKGGKVAGKVANKAGKATNKAVNTDRFQELYNEALKSAEEFGYYNPADKMSFAKDVATSNYLDEFNIVGELPEEIKAFRNGIKMTESYGISSDEVRALLKEGQPSTEWTLVKEKTPVEASVYGNDLDVDAIAKYYKKKELERQGVPYEEIIRMLGD